MAVALNETITGLDGLGTQVGDFLTNLTPGLVGFIATLGIVSAIIGLIVAIVFLVKNKIKF